MAKKIGENVYQLFSEHNRVDPTKFDFAGSAAQSFFEQNLPEWFSYQGADKRTLYALASLFSIIEANFNNTPIDQGSYRRFLGISCYDGLSGLMSQVRSEFDQLLLNHVIMICRNGTCQLNNAQLPHIKDTMGRVKALCQVIKDDYLRNRGEVGGRETNVVVLPTSWNGIPASSSAVDSFARERGERLMDDEKMWNFFRLYLPKAIDLKAALQVLSKESLYYLAGLASLTKGREEPRQGQQYYDAHLQFQYDAMATGDRRKKIMELLKIVSIKTREAYAILIASDHAAFRNNKSNQDDSTDTANADWPQLVALHDVTIENLLKEFPKLSIRQRLVEWLQNNFSCITEEPFWPPAFVPKTRNEDNVLR